MPAPTLRLADFQRVLTPENLRPLQIIFLAMVGSVSIFTLVVVLFAFTQETTAPAPDDVAVLRTLAFALIFVGLGSYTAALYLPGLIYKQGKTTTLADDVARTPEALALERLGRIRNAEIVRLALLEGIALFGLVICLLAAINGVLAERGIYWAAALPVVVILGYIALFFPTRDRVENLYRQHFE